MASGTQSRRRYSHRAEPEKTRNSANATFIQVSPGFWTNTVESPKNSATPARIRMGLNTSDEMTRGVFCVVTSPV